MAELLDHIHLQIRERRDELRPLVEEHRRLEAAMQALGKLKGEPQESPQRTARARRTSSDPKPVATQPRTRRRRGANRKAVLRAVQERPGASSTELAAVSGVKRNTLYALLARLVQEGVVQTRELPTGRKGYALGGAKPAPAATAAVAGEDTGADDTSPGE